MGRHKGDGLGRFGGRQKGTPNKVRTPLREWSDGLTDRYRRRFENGLKLLSDDQLALVLSNLMAAAACRPDYRELFDELRRMQLFRVCVGEGRDRFTLSHLPDGTDTDWGMHAEAECSRIEQEAREAYSTNI